MSLIFPLSFFAQESTPVPPSEGSYIISSYLSGNNNLFIGGNFSTIYGEPVSSLAMVYSNQSTDITFKPAIEQSSSSIIYTVNLSSGSGSDYRFVIGGTFSSVEESSNSSYLAVINPSATDGKFLQKNVFSSYPNSYVRDMYIDDKIYIGGYFTQLGTFTRNRLGAYNLNGTVNTVFKHPCNGVVNQIIPDPNNSDALYVGGSFSSISGVTRRSLGKVSKSSDSFISFNANSTFNVPCNISSLATGLDGNLYVGLYQNSSLDYTKLLCRLSPTGAFLKSLNSTIRQAFLPDTKNAVSVFKIYCFDDGTNPMILVSVKMNDNTHKVFRFFDSRGNTDSIIDVSFNSGYVDTDAPVYDIVVDSNNFIYLMGAFTTVDGVSRNLIAKLNYSGAVL